MTPGIPSGMLQTVEHHEMSVCKEQQSTFAMRAPRSLSPEAYSSVFIDPFQGITVPSSVLGPSKRKAQGFDTKHTHGIKYKETER